MTTSVKAISTDPATASKKLADNNVPVMRSAFGGGVFLLGIAPWRSHFSPHKPTGHM
jgi:hypothetical protein